ncbi:MAG: FAD:protein FMN transferase [Myxococcota bacterium]|nr:FAD:protein FMN transferase [Myxococcota bacterium]
MMKPLYAACLGFALLFPAPAPAAAQTSVIKRAFPAMGGSIELTCEGVPANVFEPAVKSAIAVVEDLENRMSEWRRGSDVDNVNRFAWERPVKVSEPVAKVIRAAQEISAGSGGGFDITFKSIAWLWKGRNHGPEAVPGDDEIKKLLPLVNYRDITLDAAASTVRLKKKGQMIGLGAIAKGYIVEEAARALERGGAVSCLVTAGADSFAAGPRPGNQPWMAPIPNPRKRGNALASFPLSKGAVSIASDIERFFIVNGRRYHHIIDPRTGSPAQGVRQVILMGPSGMLTDAWSTALFIMGPTEALRWLEKNPSFSGAIFEESGAVRATGVLKEVMQQTNRARSP